MGRNTRNALASAAAGRSVKEKHQRAARDNITVPRHLVVLPEKNIQSKHKSYFEFFENKDKRDKKLEFQVTTDPNPPPGFEFLPIGNPELTNACKELSREQDAMILIVSGAKDTNNHSEDDDVQNLALQVHRMGHHVRRTILEQAKEQVGKEVDSAENDNWQLPETQEEINAQAEAAMRDLFPRIPNFDKQMILEHAFKKGEGRYGKPLVGTSDLPLYRRVQLAVLAHIRHVHTRYDQILREVEWKVARKAVEKQCLDILVKWRGDEETGRDQLGDILREVVVISDADDDSDSDDSEDGEDSSDGDSVVEVHGAARARAVSGFMDQSPKQIAPLNSKRRRGKSRAKPNRISKTPWVGHSKKNSGSHRDKRGFNRYEAAQAHEATRNQRWEEALNRNRHAQNAEATSQAPMQRILSQNIQRHPSVEIISPVYKADLTRDDRVRPASQPFYGRGQAYDPHVRTGGAPPANYHREDRLDSVVPRPDSGFGSSEGLVIGRRVGLSSHDPRNGAHPGRPYNGELKDFLVPSVEPISPRSRLDEPQSVRRVIRAEPMRSEQVPTGQIGAPRQFVPLERLPMGMAPHNPPMDQGFRPALVPADGERVMPRHVSHYQPDFRSPLNVAPQESNRGYRIREPVPDPRYISEAAAPGTTRVMRVHREARPTQSWELESSRLRQLSPHRREANDRAAPSTAYRHAIHPRAVYREASASGFEAHSQGPLPSSTRPLYYDLHPPQHSGSWQGTHPIQPPYPSVPQSQAPVGPSEASTLRPFYQEPGPMNRTPAEYHQRGYLQRERTPSDRQRQAAPSGEPGSVQYMYEQRPPPPEIIVIR
ncbi:hypothetical protein N0V82_000812 [Gnomoniopsis sp. IMI 355080]|nr:hypothetical protein N0V82_000812 [Gnomoniopsis sp. IMI 355080]